MPVGESGRIVIEVDPAFKQELHSALAKQGVSLKQWFLGSAKNYLDQRVQPSLPLFDQDSPMEEKNEI